MPDIASQQSEAELEATGFVVGVSLGQVGEHTAIVVNERLAPKEGRPTAHHRLTFLHRFHLGTTYPDVIADVQRVIEQLPKRRDRPELVLDSTGPGRSVVKAMKDVQLYPINVKVGAGAEIAELGRDDWRVPRRELAGIMQMALQTGRLKVAEGMELTPLFRREMEAFKAKINIAAPEDFEAARERPDDDLVLAAAVTVWWGEGKAMGYSLWNVC